VRNFNRPNAVDRLSYGLAQSLALAEADDKSLTQCSVSTKGTRK
jgi:hypothetical protein